MYKNTEKKRIKPDSPSNRHNMQIQTAIKEKKKDTSHA